MPPTSVSPWLLLPFALLLLAIGVMPLVADVWWKKWYRQIVVGISLAVAGYYLLGLGKGERIVEILHDYASFIVIGVVLYTVAGGINFRLKGRSRPLENVVMLAAGALMANVIGTTGASMLLIRPYLKNNRYRLSPFHIAFFIFIVSNVGGALTPIGDPPLFLGYIRGVPFFRIAELLFLPWLTALTALLAIFYALDLRNFRKAGPGLRREALDEESPATVTGLHNLAFLAVIVGSVFITKPIFLREIVMLAAAAGSYFTTKREIYRRNDFSFQPIIEIVWLFLAVFMTMMPAIDWLSANAATLGLSAPSHFYWSTGALSGILDNAPTYLNFLSVAMGASGKNVNSIEAVRDFALSQPRHLIAISCGAVFFGAMTYIGNAPNFMVKAVAERDGARVPHFFEYIWKFSLPALLPVLVLIWILFV